MVFNRDAVAPFPTVNRATAFATTALRLTICWTETQGRRSDANLGLGGDAPLGHSEIDWAPQFISSIISRAAIELPTDGGPMPARFRVAQQADEMKNDPP